MNDLFAFLQSSIGIPLVGDNGQAVVLREASCDVVFVDMAAIQVDAWKIGLSVLITCNHEVIIVWILVVASIVGHSSQVVGVLFDWVGDIVIKDGWLVGEFFEFAGSILEIGKLSSGSDDDVIGYFFVAIDSVVL